MSIIRLLMMRNMMQRINQSKNPEKEILKIYTIKTIANLIRRW